MLDPVRLAEVHEEADHEGPFDTCRACAAWVARTDLYWVPFDDGTIQGYDTEGNTVTFIENHGTVWKIGAEEFSNRFDAMERAQEMYEESLVQSSEIPGKLRYGR